MALAVQATMAIATRRRADDILLYAARYACTGRGRLHAVKFYRDMARERRGQSAATTRYVQRGPRAGVYALASRVRSKTNSDCGKIWVSERYRIQSARYAPSRSMANIVRGRLRNRRQN